MDEPKDLKELGCNLPQYPNHPKKQNGRWHKLPKFLRFTIKFLIVVILIVIVGRSGMYIIFGITADNRMEQFLAGMKKQGISLDITALDDQEDEIPDDENAATGMFFAASNIVPLEDFLISQGFDIDSTLFRFTQESSYRENPEMLDTVEKWLDKNRDVLNVLTYYLRCEKVSFYTKYSERLHFHSTEIQPIEDLLYIQFIYSMYREDYYIFSTNWITYVRLAWVLKNQCFTVMTYPWIGILCNAMNLLGLMLDKFELDILDIEHILF